MFLFVNAQEIEILEVNPFDQEQRFNPRGLDNPGFSEDRIETLKESIKQDGLNSPLLIRGNTLIAGERRLRCILRLIADNEMCYDRNTGNYLPASDVYVKQGVPCLQVNTDDPSELTRIALQENTLHEPLTDYELLVKCQELASCGFDKSEQAKILGMSISWVNTSHYILNHHPKIKDYIKTGILTRNTAYNLLEIPSDKIEETIQELIKSTFKNKEIIIQRQTEIDNAEKAIKEAELGMSIAEFEVNGEEIEAKRRIINRENKNKQNLEENIASLIEEEGEKISVEKVKKRKRSLKNVEVAMTQREIKEVYMELNRYLGENTDDCIESYSGRTFQHRKHFELAYELVKWILGKTQYTKLEDIFLEFE